MEYCEFIDRCPKANNCLEKKKWNCSYYKFYTLDLPFAEKNFQPEYEVTSIKII